MGGGRIFGIRKDGRRGRRGGKYSFTGLLGQKMQRTALLGQRNTVLQYYLLFTIQLPKNPNIYFRYYIILFKLALNNLFID